MTDVQLFIDEQLVDMTASFMWHFGSNLQKIL